MTGIGNFSKCYQSYTTISNPGPGDESGSQATRVPGVPGYATYPENPGYPGTAGIPGYPELSPRLPGALAAAARGGVRETSNSLRPLLVQAAAVHGVRSTEVPSFSSVLSVGPY